MKRGWYLVRDERGKVVEPFLYIPEGKDLEDPLRPKEAVVTISGWYYSGSEMFKKLLACPNIEEIL